MDMQVFRQKIDEIDKSLVELFEKRMALSEEIAVFKKENNMPIYDQKREEQKLSELSAMVSDDKKIYLKELYSLIFTLSRSVQEKIINA